MQTGFAAEDDAAQGFAGPEHLAEQFLGLGGKARHDVAHRFADVGFDADAVDLGKQAVDPDEAQLAVEHRQAQWRVDIGLFHGLEVGAAACQPFAGVTFAASGLQQCRQCGEEDDQTGAGNDDHGSLFQFALLDQHGIG